MAHRKPTSMKPTSQQCGRRKGFSPTTTQPKTEAVAINLRHEIMKQEDVNQDTILPSIEKSPLWSEPSFRLQAERYEREQAESRRLTQSNVELSNTSPYTRTEKLEERVTKWRDKFIASEQLRLESGTQQTVKLEGVEVKVEDVKMKVEDVKMRAEDLKFRKLWPRD